GQLAEFQDILRVVRDLAALQKLFDAQDELARAEWFGDVIIGAQFQAKNSVNLGGFGGHHNDWDGDRGRVSAKHLANFQAVDLRQHQIEQNQTGDGGTGGAERL